MEWNLALDTFGHPHHERKHSDAPLLIDANKKEYYKNPNYYVLGHYSKFIAPDSVRVELTANKTPGGFEFIAFERPDNSVAIVVYNSGGNPVEFAINDPANGKVTLTIPAESIQSYIYWN